MRSPQDTAAAVGKIVLTGAPRAILVDAEALGDPDTETGAMVARLLVALGLDVVTLRLGDRSVAGPTVAVLGSGHPPVAGCHAWYVGPGSVPAWMHPTDGLGPETAARILGLMGTSLAQERAGAAFRAAGAGGPAPVVADYATAPIWAGISNAVARVVPTSPVAAQFFLDTSKFSDVLDDSVKALERCRAPSGAIAAAPQAGVGEPDYWFFWQRDAAHVAVAMGALARSAAAPDLAARARSLVDGYVSFVAGLGGLLTEPEAAGFSRCTLEGNPVEGYGDPQPDGPAATALAILSVVADPRVALGIARPFLDHLVGRGPDQPGFDLWELTVGRSFHATNLARRALRRAAAVARSGSDPSARRLQQAADRYSLRLRDFEIERGGLAHVLEPMPPWFAATSRLDISAVGSAMLGYDVDDDRLNVDDPHLHHTAAALERHFRERWPVNAAWRAGGNVGAGIGRFPEDCNDGAGSTGGNPWPVATLWAAQFHLRRAERMARSGRRGNDRAEVALGLGYLGFVLTHCPPGSISEQIDGATGRARGVAPLAWSHAELVTTILAAPRDWS